MSNKILLYLILLLAINVLNARAQVTGNRLTLFASGSYNNTIGAKVYEYNDFTSPGLYTNMAYSCSFSPGVDYRLQEKIYLSALINRSVYRDWEYGDELVYSDTELEMTELSLSARVVNPFSGKRKLYGYYTYLQAGPALSITKINFNNLVETRDGPNYIRQEGTTFSYILPGLKVNLGIAVVPFHSIGVFAELGYSIYLSDSYLTDENAINILSARAGVAIYFLKHKQYYY